MPESGSSPEGCTGSTSERRTTSNTLYSRERWRSETLTTLSTSMPSPIDALPMPSSVVRCGSVRVPERLQQPLPPVDPPALTPPPGRRRPAIPPSGFGRTHRATADKVRRTGRTDQSGEAPPETAASETQSTNSPANTTGSTTRTSWSCWWWRVVGRSPIYDVDRTGLKPEDDARTRRLRWPGRGIRAQRILSATLREAKRSAVRVGVESIEVVRANARVVRPEPFSSSWGARRAK